MKRKLKMQKLGLYLLLGLLAIVVVFPVFWIVSVSLRENIEVFTIPPHLFPEKATGKAYMAVLSNNRYLKYFFNSYLISLLVSFISVILGIITAYGFTRFRFRGQGAINSLIVASQTVPRVTLLIPYFILLVKYHLYNTYWGLIITFTAFCLPYAVLMMTGYMQTVSRELDEAVIVDGGSRFMALWRVIVPVSLPGIVSTLIYTFILAWNEYLFALTLTKDDAMRTVPVGIAMLMGETSYEWNIMMAFSVLASIPVLFILLFLQKYYVSGLTAGSVKG